MTETSDPEVNMLGMIMAFEQGELDDDGTVVLFQHLVDTGLAWQLQGFYGRTAMDLIEQGRVTRPGPAPHEHTAAGPADCDRCQLIRDNASWLV